MRNLCIVLTVVLAFVQFNRHAPDEAAVRSVILALTIWGLYFGIRGAWRVITRASRAVTTAARAAKHRS